MKRGRRVGERRHRRARDNARRTAEASALDTSIARRCTELDAIVRTERADVAQRAAASELELLAHLDARYGPGERAAAASLEAALANLGDHPSMCDRLIAIAEIGADHVVLAADLELQNVMDRLHSAAVPRQALAGLARLVSTKLGETETAIATAVADHQRALDITARWVESVAIAERHDRADLAEQARAVLASSMAEVTAAEAVLFEYRALHDRLSDIGRLVLDRVGHADS